MSLCRYLDWGYLIWLLKPLALSELSWWLSGKECSCNAGDTADLCLIPEAGRSPGGGNGNPLRYSFLEYPMDQGALQAVVHGIAKGQTWLSKWAHTHTRAAGGAWDLITLRVHPSYLSHCGSFCTSLNCRPFISGCSQIVVIVVCLWEEVSSRSFCSTVLAALLFCILKGHQS